MGKRSPLRTLSRFVVAALVFATSANLMSYSQPEPRPQNTVINETSFRLTLPGPWSTGDINDPSRRTYHSATRNEGLTVSIFGSFFGSPGSKSHDERTAIFKRWVEKRRQIETKMPGSADATVTEPSYGEAQGTMVARYEGFDPSRHRRFHCLVLASSSAFEIFYYEAVDVAQSLAEEHAKAIFNSVDIPK
jgi:hypothetical protein